MYLRVSLTDRCNLRCVYCLPEDVRFAPERAGPGELGALPRAIVAEAGVGKIRITGGEPSLAADLVGFVRLAADLVPTVGMTSNGVRLAPMLPALRDAGLARLNLSLDAADREGFRRLARRDHFTEVLACIRRAKALGFRPLKVNAVALRDQDQRALVDLAVREGFHLRFIELMAIGDPREDRADRYIAAPEIRGRLWETGLSLCETPARDEPTSRVWTIPGVDPADTTIGFITTTTDPFCATCDRIRLTSQGRLHNCLFDERGVDLLTALRSGDRLELHRRIRSHIAAKAPPAHFVQSAHNMAAIGG